MTHGAAGADSSERGTTVGVPHAEYPLPQYVQRVIDAARAVAYCVEMDMDLDLLNKVTSRDLLLSLALAMRAYDEERP